MRPAVAVVIPFYGDAEEAEAALARVAKLPLGPGDELVVSDNTEDGAALRVAGRYGVRVVECPVRRSAYAARNFGAEQTSAPWLLFMDADCTPEPHLLDAYFDPPPAEGTGAIAGRIVGLQGQSGVGAAYATSRQHVDHEWLLESHPFRPMTVTGNVLVRRAAFEAIGGFNEQTRSGADAELSWRLVDAGWELEYRSRAGVEHEHRATVQSILIQAARDGAGHRWLSRRYPGLEATHPLLRIARQLAGAGVWLVTARPRRALMTAIDAVWIAAWDIGTLQDNRAPARRPPPAQTVLLLGEFPRPEDPRLEELAGSGRRVRVEAVRRPERVDWRTGREIDAALLEDDGPMSRLVAVLAALRRAPRTVLAELRDPARLLRLAPAAGRLAAEPAGVTLAAEPDMAGAAATIAELAGRPGTRIETS